MIPNSVKLAHEAFVSNLHGSSPIDIILTIFPIVMTSFIASTFTKDKKYGIWCFIIEYIFCIMPLILSFTLLNQVSLEVNGAIMFLFLLRMAFYQKANAKDKKKTNTFQDKKLYCLTASRATVNVATSIAILAVDFHIFPRRFAKTETYGYSLMDVGAGCYLFMNGITDSKKTIITRQTLRDVIIIFTLGLLRVLSLHSTNYQEHVSEYGTHCNFFFTLAIIKVICMWWGTKISTKTRWFLCIAIILGNEYLLQRGIAEWTLSELQRATSLLVANREWIVSLPGNIVIYLLGISSGNFIFSRRNSALITWTLLPVLPFFSLFISNAALHLSPSRRLANLPFVAWIVGFFLLFLILYRTFEILFGQFSSQILESINSSPLLFFLLANLSTGFVNLIVNTLDTSLSVAFIIINVHAFTVCSVVYYLKSRQINKLHYVLASLTHLDVVSYRKGLGTDVLLNSHKKIFRNK